MAKFMTGVALAIGLAGQALAADNIKGVVIQANGDKAQFERAFKLADNMREVLKKTPFEVVVFGPDIKKLTAFSDALPLIQQDQTDGIKVVACERSMKTDHVKRSDLAPGVVVVPFGAVHIMRRESQGWSYFRP
ncbi:MAG: hypothetical protein M0037_06505 [Betaproteobacteria bacterium]|nr:hypothetical protein [Betaproteobacteria bacterium]